MQGDPLHAVQDVNARVKALSERAFRAQTVRDQVQQDLDRCRYEVDTLNEKIDLLAKVGELLRALMDRLVNEHVRSVESVITEGLRSIFFDQKLTFEAEIAQRYNRINVDFYIQQERDQQVIRGEPLTSFGGGPATVASLVLRILVLLKLKRTPILLLDETLSAISSEYVDQTSLFLRKLAASTGTPILLVTHKQEFTDQATIAYTASEGVGEGNLPRLNLQKLRGAAVA